MADWRNAWKYANRLPEVVRCLAHARRPGGLITSYLNLRSWTPQWFELRSGGRLELETYHDLVTAWIIFFRHEYRAPASARTILDLGANIGSYTLRAAFERPDARLVSVEPVPSTFARLLRTVADNQLHDRVAAWPFGIAARAEVRHIPAGDWPSQCVGMLPSGAAAGSSSIAIDCRPMDEILASASAHFGGDIDVLKMDIEGAEHEAVPVVSRAAMRKVRALGMEYHMNADKRELFASITRHGFALADDRPFNYGTGIAHFDRVD